MERIAAADYHDLVRVGEPRIEPGGDRVAFVRSEAADEETVESTIHVVPTDGGDARRFTVAGQQDSQPRWHPDGDFLAFCSTRGDDDRAQLWLLPTDGGEAEQLTRVGGGVSNVEWSPDGTRLCFTQQVSAADREAERDLEVPEEYEPEPPDPRVIDRMIYRSMQQYADGRRSHVYLVDADDGTIERVTEGDRDFVSPTWGDDGTLYYASKVGEVPDDAVEWELLAHDLESDTVESFARTTGWVTTIDATADGRVVFARTPEPVSLRQTNLVVHDRTSGEERTLTEHFDRTIGYGDAFRWGPDEEDVFFTSPDEGAVGVWSVPGDGSTDPTRALDRRRTVHEFSVSDDLIATVASAWDHPGDVFVHERAGSDDRRLTRVNAEYLEERAIAEPTEFWFEGGDGEVQGWLLLPPDVEADAGLVREVGETSADGGDESEPSDESESSDEQVPLVVEIHGGPHSMWTTSGTMWHEFQTLAARGYAVFWSNPRGSVGYGEDFATAIEGDWGAVTLEDVLAGADRAAAHPAVDADEQFVTGGSFGGYMTSWAVGHTDRFTAAVSQRGVYDLTGFYGSTDAFKLVEGDFGVTPWEDPEFLWEQSPVSAVPDVSTPTLVIHSDQDYRTPANTAELFYLGLKKHRVDTRMVRYPREGHELSRSGEPGHVVDRIERIARWFDGYSGYRDVPSPLERERGADLTSDPRPDEAPEEGGGAERGSGEGEGDDGGNEEEASGLDTTTR